MRKALVCINTTLYSAEEVVQELKTCQEVKEVFLVHGVYDVVAEVEGESFDDLVNVINKHIRSMNQVQTTLSLMVIDPQKPLEENDAIPI
jgi:DNA-binding Lrp family transcriptional regulator